MKFAAQYSDMLLTPLRPDFPHCVGQTVRSKSSSLWACGSISEKLIALCGMKFYIRNIGRTVMVMVSVLWHILLIQVILEKYLYN